MLLVFSFSVTAEDFTFDVDTVDVVSISDDVGVPFDASFDVDMADVDG